ncbi:MAG: glycosyltransferase family 4 protein, partial [candidate division KSB1 bacterium]|nr:glycosyltransferase family 4 protein [candidate division KSB1 bacterium]
SFGFYMRIAFIRTKKESTVITRDTPPHGAPMELKFSPKSGSSSKNIILGLQHYGLATACEEWKLWNGPFQEIPANGRLAVKLFPCDGDLTSPALARYLAANGAPEMLWVEGTEHPPYIRQIFKLCPDSFKIVYSKEWRPWKIEKLEQYDLCLVDEDWEAEEVNKHSPAVHCAVWDKLIDYETMHYPLPCEKIYDICYVAYLRPRKNHELLFRAMAKLQDRKLTCVCVGDDRKGNRLELEKLAAELNLAVHFTGEVPKEQVNRYINQSKIGVMPAVLDAAPRAILEYMAADVPVLVNSELWAGARYVGPGAGLVKSPEEFHLGLAALLDNYQNYSPRAYLLQNYSFGKVMAKFIEILERAGYQFSRRNVNALG